MSTDCLSPQSTFGERLRSWRLVQGLSQEAFGQLFDPRVPRSTVCCWENGRRNPAWKRLGQIVALTGIPAHLVLGVASTAEERP